MSDVNNLLQTSVECRNKLVVELRAEALKHFMGSQSLPYIRAMFWAMRSATESTVFCPVASRRFLSELADSAVNSDSPANGCDSCSASSAPGVRLLGILLGLDEKGTVRASSAATFTVSDTGLTTITGV